MVVFTKLTIITNIRRIASGEFDDMKERQSFKCNRCKNCTVCLHLQLPPVYRTEFQSSNLRMSLKLSSSKW